MKLIHVHGFSELGPESLITTRYRKSAKEIGLKLDVEEYRWNTLDSNITKLVANFCESDRRVKEAAARLVETIAAEKGEIILSGHSLGGAILLEALELNPHIPNLHSVILLGTAYPQKNTLSRIQQITPRHYALNYHSPTWDLALSQAYFNAKGHIAIGTNGLLNPGVFENVYVNCTHTGETGYTRLISGIVGLLAHTREIASAEEVQYPWLPFSFGNAGDWEDLHRTNGHIIQRSCVTGHFRVIEVGGVQRECFHSKSVIPLMDAIAALPR